MTSGLESRILPHSTYTRRAARWQAAIGPAVIGLAAWCANCHVTVLEPTSASVRLAAPSAWWVGVVAAAIAALVPAWRTRPATTIPALFSTLPWWPIPLPPLALLFTGPLAWLPIALSLVAAIGETAKARANSERPERPELGVGPQRSKKSRHALLAGALTLLAGLVTAWSVAPRLPTGDEPHYLVITQSLLSDGDLRIENNHARGDTGAYASASLRPDFIRRGRDGQIYSIHAPGVAVVVLPGFLAAGYRGAQATILILAALGGALVWSAAWRASGEVGAAWFAWAAVVGSATALLQSAMVFPDGPGACAVAAAVWLLVRLAKTDAPPSARLLVVVSCALAALPWLHTRFAVIAGGLGAAIVWRLWIMNPATRAGRLGRLLVFLTVPAVSAIGWFGYFQLIYGTPNPSAPYGTMAESSWLNVPGGFFGLLFDQQFGLLIFAPVLALAFVEFMRPPPLSELRWTKLGLWCGGIVVAYLAVSATYWMWWAGKPATPARLATAVLPLLAVPLAGSWARASAAGRTVRWLLLLLSLTISAVIIGVDRGQLAWNGYDAQAAWLERLAPVVNLPRGVPSFFWQLDATPRRVSEIPFFIHVVVWLAIVSLAIVAGRRLVRRRRVDGVSIPLVVCCATPLVVAALVQAGWWLTKTNGLDPARSQVAVLTRMAEGSRAYRIAPASLSRAGDAASRMVIAVEQAGVHDPAPLWGGIRNLPPGTYDLEIRTDRPQRGVLNLAISSTPVPWRSVTLQPLSVQSVSLTLPAGAASLAVVPDRDLSATGARGAVVLKPRRIDRPNGDLARSAVSYGMADVFFLDGATFVEPTGFWVRGGQTARFVVQPSAGPALTLQISNGPVANVVELDLDGGRQVLSLAPGEARDVALGTGAAARVTLRSSSGFRPSDQGAADGRFLGVRVEVR